MKRLWRRFTEHRRLWAYRILVLVVTALIAHLGSLWLFPRFVMYKVLAELPPLATGDGEFAYFPPMTDHSQRRIVMPSPDLLYALCAYDLGQGAVHVTADPKLPTYWSIALYAANTDNFLAINDREAAGRPIDLVVVPSAGAVPEGGLPAGARIVVSPSARGLLLMRVLAADYAARAAGYEAARRTLSCRSLG